MITLIKRLWRAMSGASLPTQKQFVDHQLAYCELELLKAIDAYEVAKHNLAMYRERVDRLRDGGEGSPRSAIDYWGLTSREARVQPAAHRTTTPSSS